MHPIVLLQGRLLAILGADAALTGLIGSDGVFDTPPKGRAAPYVVIARHDVLARDGDVAPGHEHRLLLHVWHPEPSRRAALAIAERVIAALLGGELSSAGLAVTHCTHVRTDTAIEGGRARAAVSLRLFSEPA